jgi:hypothetical protein
MLFRIIIFIAAALTVASVQAEAQDRVGFGQGMRSCGAWTRARETKSGQGLYTQWVAGFLTGLNMDDGEPDALIGTDFDGLMAWIDNYCRAKPLVAVIFAADELLKELRSRAKRGTGGSGR